MENNLPYINGLKLFELSSETRAISPIVDIENLSIGDLLQIIGKFLTLKSLVVAYLDYKVLIGNYSDNSLTFCNSESIEPKYIQRIRIFNKNEELFLWRREGNLEGRYRKDDEKGKGSWIVESNQVLFGTIARKIEKGFTEISEARGTKIILPFDNISVDEKNNRIKIKTYNYVGFNEIHQATYMDCRFAEFTDFNNVSLEV
jgi:CRISPR-associated protein (TIGR03984 family)